MGEKRESGIFVVNTTNKERKTEAGSLHTYEKCLMIGETETPRSISFRIRKKKVKTTLKRMKYRKIIKICITQFLKGVEEMDKEKHSKDYYEGSSNDDKPALP